ncbi:MAG TPA: hypothetical protein VF244_07755 [Acidimicrobiales bacterium]
MVGPVVDPGPAPPTVVTGADVLTVVAVVAVDGAVVGAARSRSPSPEPPQPASATARNTPAPTERVRTAPRLTR